jgi:hypothetical protein
MRNGKKPNAGSTEADQHVDAAAALSPEDQANLSQFENKLQVVRDRTAGVAKGYTTGFYLFGGGGVGKSFTVLDELNRMKARYVTFNSRMTGRGLFDALEKYPDAVHVLEEMEQLTRDRAGQGVLRSALWAQRPAGHKGPCERPMTWTTNAAQRSFIFSGGIILISNRPLDDLPELAAVKTRIPVMNLQASDGEMRALMRSVARKGYEHLDKQVSAKDCAEICEFIIEQAHALQRPLDMRLLVGSFDDFLQWDDADAIVHWEDLVRTRLRERAVTFAQEVATGPRRARKRQEQQIAREIAKSTRDRKERARLWKERTQKSEQALYRRLAELKQG